jgi:DNA mismatch repair ATPase MutL
MYHFLDEDTITDRRRRGNREVRSVIKEHVENSIDAGATRIFIEVIDGGKSLAIVNDDGCGIAQEDQSCHRSMRHL